NRGFYYMNGFSFLVAEKQSQTTYNNSQSQVTEFKKSLKAVNSACEEVLADRSLGLLDFHLDLVSLEAATKVMIYAWLEKENYSTANC
ncbi:hypothetical protein HN873_012484, partial [Arachis hypogaea]